MLQAMNTGHDGSLTTVHANSSRDALSRIETMVLMAGLELPVRAIRGHMSSALDLIIHLERLEDGSRRVTHITEMQRMEGDVITLQDIYEFKVDSLNPDRTISGQLAADRAAAAGAGASSRSAASSCRRTSSSRSSRAHSSSETEPGGACETRRRPRRRPRRGGGGRRRRRDGRAAAAADRSRPRRRARRSRRRQYILSLPGAAAAQPARTCTCSRTASRCTTSRSQLPGAGETRVGAILADRRVEEHGGRPDREGDGGGPRLRHACSEPRRARRDPVQQQDADRPAVHERPDSGSPTCSSARRRSRTAPGSTTPILSAEQLLREQQIDVGVDRRSSRTAPTSARVADLEPTLAAAKAGNARIFAVGLESPQFDPADAQGVRRRHRRRLRAGQDHRRPDADLPPDRSSGSRASTSCATSRSPAAARRCTSASTSTACPALATTSYTAPGLPTGAFVDDQSWLDRLIQSPCFAVLVSVAHRRADRLRRLHARPTARPAAREPHVPLRARCHSTSRRLRRQAEVQETLEEDEETDESGASCSQSCAGTSTLEYDVEIGRIRFSAGSIVLFTVLASARRWPSSAWR